MAIKHRYVSWKRILKQPYLQLQWTTVDQTTGIQYILQKAKTIWISKTLQVSMEMYQVETEIANLNETKY